MEARLSEIGLPIGRATLSRIERGERRPDIVQLWAIAEAFQTGIDWLLTDHWETDPAVVKAADEITRKANRQMMDDIEGAQEIFLKDEPCMVCGQPSTSASSRNHPHDNGIIMVAVCSAHAPPSEDVWFHSAVHVMGYRLP
jgi:transcriptional regulator with XRE-family HTH domain